MRIKWVAYLCIDLLLIAAATVAALILRDNLELSADRSLALLPYLCITLVVACIALCTSGAHRSIWRLSTMHDYLRIVVLVPLVVAVSAGIGFALTRLDAVPRAVPILQTLLMLVLLLGARLFAQLRHTLRNQPRQLLPEASCGPQREVLVVGLSRLTEAYLGSVTEYAVEHVHVAGVLGRYNRQVGRSVGSVPILGEPEHLASVLLDLQTHGVVIDQIVVAIPQKELSWRAAEQLRSAAAGGEIEVRYLTEMLGLEPSAGGEPRHIPSANLAFSFEKAQLEAVAGRPYWKVKRALDIFAASLLVLFTSPLLLICSVLVALDLGLPVTFWQRRPGLAGKPFQLCKLRTMRAPQLDHGPAADDARVSRIGAFLRRTRMDELPQLYNILIGDMSFVGPRPLLPVDQAPQHRARLLVRPGLTGWAQIAGGRSLSQEDKVALDIWYVQNASFWLDFKILARTLPMVLFGERVVRSEIQQAWSDLKRSGIYRVASDPS